jgi:hypothetical protein
MFAIRQILISTIALAVIPPVCLRGAEIAEYVGGTAKSIPVNATGSLSVNATKELRFNYGESVYKLSADQITGTEILQGETRHILHKIPVPSFRQKKETLAINFKDAAGANGTVNFQLSPKQANSVREQIDAWKAPAPQVAGAKDPNEWWGDRYWKTNRNKDGWQPATAATPAPAVPAAPAATPATGGTK